MPSPSVERQGALQGAVALERPGYRPGMGVLEDFQERGTWIFLEEGSVEMYL